MKPGYTKRKYGIQLFRCLEQFKSSSGVRRHSKGKSMEEELNHTSAFEKDPFKLTAEDVYDMSYVIGRDLFKLSSSEDSRTVSELQYKVIRVLEIFELLVDRQNLTVEKLKIERDNLRKETERLHRELQVATSDSEKQQKNGSDKLVVDVNDPNRPRFTLQELTDVLQERNKLKAQLLVAQEELECYKSGLVSTKDPQRLEKKASGANRESEQTTVKKLFSLKYRKNH
ncbi:RILP-like protein 2 [Rhincodon typus]|uniref:RILP-like protein 2 n=1 Tax=Rhincodon typus TaxID=259920 RepID=UPI00202F2CB9|nr:RILP-like protein 2 [Rhincodon typus]